MSEKQHAYSEGSFIRNTSGDIPVTATKEKGQVRRVKTTPLSFKGLSENIRKGVIDKKIERYNKEFFELRRLAEKYQESSETENDFGNVVTAARKYDEQLKKLANLGASIVVWDDDVFKHISKIRVDRGGKPIKVPGWAIGPLVSLWTWSMEKTLVPEIKKDVEETYRNSDGVPQPPKKDEKVKVNWENFKRLEDYNMILSKAKGKILGIQEETVVEKETNIVDTPPAGDEDVQKQETQNPQTTAFSKRSLKDDFVAKQLLSGDKYAEACLTIDENYTVVKKKIKEKDGKEDVREYLGRRINNTGDLSKDFEYITSAQFGKECGITDPEERDKAYENALNIVKNNRNLISVYKTVWAKNTSGEPFGNEGRAIFDGIIHLKRTGKANFTKFYNREGLNCGIDDLKKKAMNISYGLAGANEFDKFISDLDNVNVVVNENNGKNEGEITEEPVVENKAVVPEKEQNQEENTAVAVPEVPVVEEQPDSHVNDEYDEDTRVAIETNKNLLSTPKNEEKGQENGSDGPIIDIDIDGKTHETDQSNNGNNTNDGESPKPTDPVQEEPVDEQVRAVEEPEVPVAVNNGSRIEELSKEFNNYVSIRNNLLNVDSPEAKKTLENVNKAIASLLSEINRVAETSISKLGVNPKAETNTEPAVQMDDSHLVAEPVSVAVEAPDVIEQTIPTISEYQVDTNYVYTSEPEPVDLNYGVPTPVMIEEASRPVVNELFEENGVIPEPTKDSDLGFVDEKAWEGVLADPNNFDANGLAVAQLQRDDERAVNRAKATLEREQQAENDTERARKDLVEYFTELNIKDKFGNQRDEETVRSESEEFVKSMEAEGSDITPVQFIQTMKQNNPQAYESIQAAHIKRLRRETDELRAKVPRVDDGIKAGKKSWFDPGKYEWNAELQRAVETVPESEQQEEVLSDENSGVKTL